MKDHEKRELVSELVGIASIAHGTEQLRDRIAYALSGVFSAIDGVTVRADKAEAELAQKLEKAEGVLRSLAGFVGAGGYNADKVDADVFEQKIRWGIGQIMERAGAAEAELAKLRKQKPVAWINLNKWTPSNGPRCVTPEEYEKELELLTKLTAVYAAPVPAVAVPAVPEEWREVMKELADDLAIEIDQDYPPERRAYPSEQRKYEGEMVIVNRARALLQSANHSEQALEKVAPDCRACANRGRINGLSQESFCDSCVWQGMSFRKNHYAPNSPEIGGIKIDAATDRLLEGGK